MSANNQEIEIKFSVDKKTFLKIRERLKKIAKFIKRSSQIDEYYSPIHRNFLKPKFPFEWLSIRERGGKFILNYKHWYPENAEINTHCDEFETKFEKPDQLKKTLLAFDFKKLVKVEKEREIYIFKDVFEIMLDTVKNLGHFIEIESIKDFGSVSTTREKLFEFAKNLQINLSKIDKRGYPYLLLKKKGLLT